MANLKCTTDGRDGQGPGDRLINNQTGYQKIHPDFAYLEREKAAIIMGLSPKTGSRSVSIGPMFEQGGKDVSRR